MYENAGIVVVVSGIGKVAMAGAVAYTMAQFGDSAQPVLLNLGVAGHRNQSIGSCFLADKIIDAETGRRFYPQLPFDLPCRTLPLKTLSKADAGYADDCLCDMEASAFYEIATKFGSGELIHCLKVVSDNAESPLENINEQSVAAWVEANLAVVEELIAALRRLRQSLPAADNDLYRQLLGRFHFTASNAVKLQSLLHRCQLLAAEGSINFAEANAENARELLVWLESRLDKKPFYL